MYRDWIVPLISVALAVTLWSLLLSGYTLSNQDIVSQKVDSRWQGGPDDWNTSLDYMDLHPVCRDALRFYVLSNHAEVAWMCNMVGDIWVADLMNQENSHE